MSQIGLKERKLNHPESHPYWETADYQAMCGFIEEVLDSGAEPIEPRIRIIVAKHADAIPHLPFPNQMDMARKAEWLEDLSDVTPSEENCSPFLARKWISVEPDNKIAGLLRSEILPELLTDCGAAIVLGGGKATRHFMSQARAARKLILIAPACNCAFSEIEKEGFKGLGAFRKFMQELAHDFDGDLPNVCAEVVRTLPKISRLLQSDMTRSIGLLSATGSLEADRRIESLQKELGVLKDPLWSLADVFQTLYALVRICVNLYQYSWIFPPEVKESDFRDFLSFNLSLDYDLDSLVQKERHYNGGRVDISCFKIPIETKVKNNKNVHDKQDESQTLDYGVLSTRRISFLCILDCARVPAASRPPEKAISIVNTQDAGTVICIVFTARFASPSL